MAKLSGDERKALPTKSFAEPDKRKYPIENQGGYKLHVHTVMRDLGNDYAKQLV